MGNTKSKKVTITSEPTKMPKGLAVNATMTQYGITCTASWDYDKKSTDKKSKSRYEGIYLRAYCLVDDTPRESPATVKIDTGQKVAAGKLTTNAKVTKNKKGKIKTVQGEGKNKKASKKFNNKKAIASSASTSTGASIFADTGANGSKYKTGTKSYSYVIAGDGVEKKNARIEDFNPYNVDRTLLSVVVLVQGYNTISETLDKKKAKKAGSNPGMKKTNDVPTAANQAVFAPPFEPLTSRSYVSESKTATLKATCKFDGTEGRHWNRMSFDARVERIDEKDNVTVIVPNSSMDPADYSQWIGDGYDLEKSWSWSPGGRAIQLNEKYRLRIVSLVAKGVGGDTSAKLSNQSKTSSNQDLGASDVFDWAYPDDPTPPTVDANSSNNMVNIKFGIAGGSINRKTEHFVLQKLENFLPEQRYIFSDDNTWKSLANEAAGWADVGKPVAPNIRAFARNLAYDRPPADDPYVRTYYRIVATNEVFHDEGGDRIGGCSVLPIFKRVPSAKNERVDFLEVVPESDGTSVRVVLAYNVGAYSDPPSDALNNSSDSESASYSDGCEISWSEDQFAWLSNQGPSTFDMPDKDVLGSLMFRQPRDDSQWLVPIHLTDAGNQPIYVVADVPPYTPITNIDKNANPSAQHWRERRRSSSGKVFEYEYPASTDVKVQDKTYCKPTNPHDANLYEKNGDVYVRTNDSSIVNGKTYYTNTNPQFTKLKAAFEYTSKVYIRGLTEGTDYYFRARRYLEADGSLPRTYGEYTDYSGNLKDGDSAETPTPVRPTTKPKNVKIKVPKAVPVGKSADVSWTFEGEGKQTYWQLLFCGDSSVTKQQDPDDSTKEIYKIIPYDRYTAVQSPVPSNPKAAGLYEKKQNLEAYMLTADTSVSSGKVYYTRESFTPSQLAEGRDAAGYYVIPYEREEQDGQTTKLGLKDALGDQDAVWVAVAVATSGDAELSNAERILCVKPPVAYLSVPETITSQPFTITLGTTDVNVSAIVRIFSVNSTVLQHPDGVEGFPDGYTVFSEKYPRSALDWKPYPDREGYYYVNLRMKSGMELLDNQRYRVELTLQNEENGLNSLVEGTDGEKTPVIGYFDVHYSRKMYPPPSVAADKEHMTYVTSDKSSLQTRIHLGSDLHSVGDLCDIYRVTPDGPILVRDGLSFGQDVIDLFAPYTIAMHGQESVELPNGDIIKIGGDMAYTRYRICVRSSDGLESWDDFGYVLNDSAMRFDWSDLSASSGFASLTVPYDLDYSDAYSKSFEARPHMGQSRPSGYWASNVDRTTTINTKIIKFYSAAEKEALRSLARYAGAVMVRRPDGCAYLANVEVNKISDTYNDPVVSVSFKVTEVGMMDEFSVSPSVGLSEADKNYYDRLDETPDVYSVADVQAGENPQAMGLYVIDENGVYALTTDVAPMGGTVYYSRTTFQSSPAYTLDIPVEEPVEP